MGNTETKPLSRRISVSRSSFKGSYTPLTDNVVNIPICHKAKDSKLHLDRYWIGATVHSSTSSEIQRCYTTSQLHASNSVDGLTTYSNHLNALAASQAFKHHRSDLLGVAKDSMQVVSLLLSNEIIPEATKARILLSNFTVLEKCEALCDAIEARIIVQPQVFHTTVKLLETEDSYKMLSTKLLSSYSEYSEVYATHLKAITQPAIVRYADHLKSHYRTMQPLSRYKWLQPISKKPFNLVLGEQPSRSVSVHNDVPASFKKYAAPFTNGGVITLHYMMSPLEGSDKIGCVFLRGVAGVGKSSLTVELCRHWKNIASLKRYHLVILLKAQDKTVQEAKTLTDLFSYHKPSYSQAIAEEAAASEGNGILLILDGLDQVPLHSALFLDILQGKCIPQASLLITTRPDAAPRLMSSCKRKVDRIVELVGFTEDEIEQHAESVLGHDPSLLSDFHNYLSANPVIRDSLHVPLNTAVAVAVYKQTHSNGEQCSMSICCLYQQLAKYLLRHHLLVKGTDPCDYIFPKEMDKLPVKVYSQFVSLAKQAFMALLNHEPMWTRLLKSQYHLGFMIGVPELYGQKRTSLMYNYIHVHVQELLTAFHVKNMSAPEQIDLYHKHFSTPVFQNVWKFLAGIDKFESPFWDELKSTAHQDGSLSLFLLHCLYEVFHEVPLESFLSLAEFTFPQSKLGEQITPLDCYRLGCCLAHSSCRVDLRQRLNTNMLNHLHLGLQSTEKTKSSIRTLFLRPTITTEMIQTLKKLPPRLIEGLDVSHCDLDRITAQSIASVLPSLSDLKELDIRGNPGIGEGGMAKVLSALTCLESLETLNVINTGICTEDINTLSPLLGESGHLRTLVVGEEHQSGLCVHALLEMAFTSFSLHSLHLWLMDLEPHVAIISSLLAADNNNITTLEFHGCRIGQEGCRQIAEAMVENKTLTRVVFSMFDVVMCHQLTADGAKALADMLVVNRTLEDLEISFDRTIGRSGALALLGSLKQNNTLHSLKLPQQNLSFADHDLSEVDGRLEWL